MISRILHAALFCLTPEGFWGLPLLLWGEPGTGKTSLVAALARALGEPFERLSPAERGEGQFGVVPVPSTDGFLCYPAPEWARKFDEGGLIFVDEINTAVPAIQAPLLGFVQLRTLGAHRFGPRVRVLGAANETADAAGAWDLAPALRNRFGHLNFEGLAASDWTVGLLGGFASQQDGVKAVSARAEEARVEAAWPAADAWARGLVAGFITRRPALLHVKPKKGDPALAWPSRRSVEYATVALAASRVHDLTEIETDEFLAAFVGESWVREFATWRAAADLPDPADLLDGKVQWEHDPRRLDRTIAVLGACAALVAPTKAQSRKPRAAACWRLLGGVLKDAADVAVPAARVLVNAGGLTHPMIPEATPVIARIQPMLAKAGINIAAKAGS